MLVPEITFALNSSNQQSANMHATQQGFLYFRTSVSVDFINQASLEDYSSWYRCTSVFGCSSLLVRMQIRLWRRTWISLLRGSLSAAVHMGICFPRVIFNTVGESSPHTLHVRNFISIFINFMSKSINSPCMSLKRLNET